MAHQKQAALIKADLRARSSFVILHPGHALLLREKDERIEPPKTWWASCGSWFGWNSRPVHGRSHGP